MFNINPRQMRRAMKQLGMKMEEIDAEEVVIKCADKDIVILNPEVAKVDMRGQVSFQITGEPSERSKEKFSAEDIQMVVEQTGCTEDVAMKTLEETGDLAGAILKLKGE